MSRYSQLREEALGELLKAKALSDPATGQPKAEDADAFNTHMAKFAELDSDAAKAATTEDNAGTLAQRLSDYVGQATGTPLAWSRRIEADPRSGKSLGQIFIESDEYKRAKDDGRFAGDSGHISFQRVVLGSRVPVGAAANDIIQTESGGPGNALIQPYRPGLVLPLPQAQTVVRDLFANEDMPEGDTIEYAAQTGFSNAAAAVKQAQTVNGSDAAGGLKPQSSIAWAERSAKATWIATWMAATRQALRDATQLRALIDNQGRLMIKIEEDRQLIDGNGTAPNLIGLMNISGLQTLDLTGEDNLDGIRTGRRLVQTGLSRLQPTGIVVNPVDSEEFDLLKDGFQQYRGGNPIGNFNFDQSIWRLRRAESEAIEEGHALVVARAAATVYDRDPLGVRVAEQHADFFVRNLVAILFEERLAFPIYFPTGLVDVTLADWAAGS